MYFACTIQYLHAVTILTQSEVLSSNFSMTLHLQYIYFELNAEATICLFGRT